MPAIKVTGPKAKEMTTGAGLCVLDVYADWCGPCKMLAPFLDQIADEQGINIIKLNSDEFPAETNGYGVSALPTIIVFKDGKEVERFMGFRAKPQIEAIIAKHK